MEKGSVSSLKLNSVMFYFENITPTTFPESNDT